MIIAETTVWIDYFNEVVSAQTEWLDQGIRNRSVALLDLILYEVLQGFRDDREFERVRKEFEAFEVFELGGKATAVAAARNYQVLRKRGITIRKTIDVLIATFCIENGHTLLHKDRDFNPFEQYLGLRVLHTS